MDFLNEVEKKLDLPPAEKAQVMRELRSHYEELRDEFTGKGMDASQAEQEAARRLGEPDDLASRLQSVHCRATWKAALLTAMPFLGLILRPLAIKLALHYPCSHWIRSLSIHSEPMLFCAVMLTGSIIALRGGKRPVWLATWLAAGIALPLWAAQKHLNPLYLADTGSDLAYWCMLTTVAAVLLFGAMTLWILWRSLRWRRITLYATILVILAVILAYRVLPSDIFFLLCIASASVITASFVMAIALQLFARHPYGNAPLASLFLFTTYLYSKQQITSYYLLHGEPLPLLMFAITVLVVTLYARLSTWQRKLTALTAGAVLTGMINSIEYIPMLGSPEGALYIGVTIGGALILTAWVVLVPLWYARKYQTL